MNCFENNFLWFFPTAKKRIKLINYVWLWVFFCTWYLFLIRFFHFFLQNIFSNLRHSNKILFLNLFCIHILLNKLLIFVIFCINLNCRWKCKRNHAIKTLLYCSRYRRNLISISRKILYVGNKGKRVNWINIERHFLFVYFKLYYILSATEYFYLYNSYLWVEYSI